MAVAIPTPEDRETIRKFVAGYEGLDPRVRHYLKQKVEEWLTNEEGPNDPSIAHWAMDIRSGSVTVIVPTYTDSEDKPCFRVHLENGKQGSISFVRAHHVVRLEDVQMEEEAAA